MKKNPYEVDLRYDYRNHWSRRDREDPRLKHQTETETWEWITDNSAEQMAMHLYKDGAWKNDNDVDEAYQLCVARDIHGMVQENLYGWGDMALNRIQDEGYDAFFEEVYEIGKMKTYRKFNKKIVEWAKLHLRDVSVRYSTFDDFSRAEAGYIAIVFPAGIDTRDWLELKAEAGKVTDAILADRAAAKAAAGGFWTGD